MSYDGKFDVVSILAISLGAVVVVVALVWGVIGCYGGERPGKFSGEKDGALAVLEGGVQVADTVSQFEGCCCGGGVGGIGGCGGCGG